VAPAVARAQPARKVYRIGILSSRSATSEMVGSQPQDPHINALLRGLRELGYVDGEHFVTEPRGGEGKAERFATLAAELVRLQVDVIVAAGPTLGALKQATWNGLSGSSSVALPAARSARASAASLLRVSCEN
jgi:putative tryptophan/tyrosine transport system substrate-binding protein